MAPVPYKSIRTLILGTLKQLVAWFLPNPKVFKEVKRGGPISCWGGKPEALWGLDGWYLDTLKLFHMLEHWFLEEYMFPISFLDLGKG